MQQFNNILNWKLLGGSHEFPGPDGGTCINEAAIVAAGYKYKKVSSWKDCPKCFSPILSQFSILVNDLMLDEMRQDLLLPFVTKLGGTKTTREIEERREQYIYSALINLIVYPLMKGRSHKYIGFNPTYGHSPIQSCQVEKDMYQYKYPQHMIGPELDYMCSRSASMEAIIDLTSLIGGSMRQNKLSRLEQTGISYNWAKILEKAIAIGKPKEIPIELAIERINKVKELAHAD